MRRLFIGCLAAAATTFGAASAATLTGAQLASACNNVANCNPTAGVSLAGAPGQLVANTVGGLQGIGVSGSTPGELDFGETITVQFATAVVLNSFTLGAFFNGDEFGDNNERGFLTAFYLDGTQQQFEMNVTGENTATINGGFGAVVTNCGATTADGSGCFKFANNPLSSKLITQLVFTAANKPTQAGGQSNNSDYILSGLEYSLSQVPVPGAIAFLLTGLAGLGAAQRKNRKAA